MASELRSAFKEGSMRACVFVGAVIGILLTTRGETRGDSGKEVEAERIARLIKQLGDDGFEKREAASKELGAIGEPALAALRKAGGNDDAEVRRRAEDAVRSILGRVSQKELAALQGTWNLLTCIKHGKETFAHKTGQLVFDQGKVAYKQNGATHLEGKVELDPTANPRRLDQYFGGRTDLTIYVRVGDYLIQCGNVDSETRPTEFVSGSKKGGVYLNLWKREG
jgi:uncharacterized protein (TIGR03067 family)